MCDFNCQQNVMFLVTVGHTRRVTYISLLGNISFFPTINASNMCILLTNTNNCIAKTKTCCLFLFIPLQSVLYIGDIICFILDTTLHWRNNEREGVSNHQSHDCLLNCLFKLISKKISKLRVNGLCAGNSPVTGEFHAQRASNVENVSIWWHHHEYAKS